jgi:hypothetical protein
VIGAKTLTTIALVGIGLAAALGLHALSAERLAARGFQDLFLVGGFGVIAGTVLYRLWSLGEPSRHYFRWATDVVWEHDEAHFLGARRRRIVVGENRGDAFDFPPLVQVVLCVAAATLVGVSSLDASAVDRLGKFSSAIASAGTYCPTETPVAPVAAVVEDAHAPGCELIRRAFALGYTDSLGDCAPKQRAQASEAKAPCNLRQRDEPFLHYSWRLWTRFWDRLRAPPREQAGGALRTKLAHLGALGAIEREVLDSAPHATHHLFTNLPDPGGAFRAESCGDRYRFLPHRPPDESASRGFEHVVGQLLFEARYEPAAAACREVHVHFGAAPDTCARLAAEPERVLRDAGALPSVRAVLERHRLESELVALGRHAPALPAGAYLGFACYFEGDAPSSRSFTFTLDGQSLAAEEVRARPRGFVERYDAIARALVHGFHYGALLSEAGLEPPARGSLDAAFAGRDYLLSRLYSLGDVDLYLDPSWIASRPDLLEVYPYQRHLKNYVHMFRRQFALERGRL